MSSWNDSLVRLAWEQFWQVTVVIFIVALFTKVLCRRRPHLAYILWMVVLVKCVTPPLWSSPTGLFSWAKSSVAVGPLQSLIHPPQIAPQEQPNRVVSDKASVDLTGPTDQAPQPHGPTDVFAGSVGPVGIVEPVWQTTLVAILGLAWGLGVVAYACLTWLAFRRFSRIISRYEVSADMPLTELCAKLVRKFNVRGGVRLLLVQEPIGPLTYGWFRPTIVFPWDLAAKRSTAELEPLLAHEINHVRRGDALVGWLQVLVQGAWWFHPLVWWANRQILRQRESCCDEEVVAKLDYSPKHYAQSLLSVLELKHQWRSLVVLPGVQTLEITKQRMEYLMLYSNRFHKKMPRSYWLVLFVGVLMLAPGAGLTRRGALGLASPPESATPESEPTKPTVPAHEDQPISAAKLVQAWYDSQAWINSARSFYIRTQDNQYHTEEARRWEEEHPVFNPFSNKKMDFPPYTITTQWAWDESRIHYQQELQETNKPAEVHVTTRIWDGSLGMDWLKRPKHDQYVLDNKPDRLFRSLVEHHMLSPWGDSINHRFWWYPVDVNQARTSSFLAPEDFELLGQEVINGRLCNVVQSRAGQVRMWFDVDHGRRYRYTRYLPFQGTPNSVRLALMQKIGGPAIKNGHNFYSWTASLDPTERTRALREHAIGEFEFARPWGVQTSDDYREVKPGCWLPFRRTSDYYNLESPEHFLDSRCDEIVQEVTVDQPLADDLFHIELADGVPVATDWRYDPPIRYTYRKDQTEAERVALSEEQRGQQAQSSAEMKKHQEALESRKGSAPPSLPEQGWLDGKSLAWEQLRGKVVMLNFWDVNCGPCAMELPFVAKWHENSSENGLVVIGIHRPTEDLEAVRKKMAEFKMTYPVLIDAPALQPGGIGQLHDWFGNSWWPNTVLINKNGLVAGYGRLFGGDISDQLRRLIDEPEKATAEPDGLNSTR